MSYWKNINSPSDLKKLSIKELEKYADELREHIISTSISCGGHLASNLGVIELTIALHYVFDCPIDKIVWDVGHQAYVHKIITGRRQFFDDNLLRKNGGITGFPAPNESNCDSFIAGHSSTSLSVVSGFIKARKLQNKNHNIIAVIGDGSFTGGMVYEALNDIGASGQPAIIILNDNDMSISHNVGAVNKYFNSLRLSKNYMRFKSDVKKGLSGIPIFGDEILSGAQKLKDGLKSIVIKEKMFEQFGFKYYGPYDGHNIEDLVTLFELAKTKNKPVILHLITQKGHGYNEAENNPEKYHGISAPCGKKSYEFSVTMGDTLCELAKIDERVIGVTAAMASGTGMERFEKHFPERYIDVGIAEQNAVTMCAAMAKEGLKPYLAIYSTFLQRGFDQIIHDVCIQNLPVTFLIDRAGVVGADGVTHQGVFDLSYLSLIPNMTIVSPKDVNELKQFMHWSLDYNAPLAIRYPKSCSTLYESYKIEFAKWQLLKEEKSNIYLLVTGCRAVDEAMKTTNANVVNCMFIKPLDKEFLSSIDNKNNVIITIEDNILHGGFGWAVSNAISNCRVINIGHKDEFIFDLDISSSLVKSNFNQKNIKQIINDILLEK